MKQVIKLNSLFLLMLIIVASSCKKVERELNTNVTAVAALSLPVDMYTVALQPTTNSSEVFKWDAVTPEDEGLVLYEIAFDKVNGDFSNPVYKTLSDGGGVQTQATITHKNLVKIAALGGINASSTGSLKWTVIASKSLNKKLSEIKRTIQLQRPAGFAEIPTDLYITGTASEGGADITTAVKLKKIDDGVFEIYTSLKPGTYYLTNKNAVGGKHFYIAGAVIKEGPTDVTVTGTTKVYRLKYDFNVASVLDATEIQGIAVFMSAYNSEIGQLNYAGNSKWESAPIPVVFFQFSWGRDERYKFAIHTSTGVEYVGSLNANNVSPVGQPASYFFVYPVTNAQWDYTYKFNPIADNHNVKVTVDYNTAGPYTHNVLTL